MPMTTSCPQNHVQLPVSRSVQWTFEVDHVTMVETCIALLTTVRKYCSELRSLRQTSTYVISPLQEFFILCTNHHHGQDTQNLRRNEGTDRHIGRHTVKNYFILKMCDRYDGEVTKHRLYVTDVIGKRQNTCHV